MSADFASFFLLSAAVFAGAFVSGLAGFAFSAVAGGVLLHTLEPLEAVPLMMACSVGVQAANLWAFRKSIEWQRSSVLIIGDCWAYRSRSICFRIPIRESSERDSGYSLHSMRDTCCFVPTLSKLRQMQSHRRDALVGFGGGLIGGLTAMPGALPTIWCDMHGLPKNQQRGVVQPFIAAMQLFALALMLSHHNISAKVLVDFAISVPGTCRWHSAGHFDVSPCQRIDVQTYYPRRPGFLGAGSGCIG